jgi:hypothetical protein
MNIILINARPAGLLFLCSSAGKVNHCAEGCIASTIALSFTLILIFSFFSFISFHNNFFLPFLFGCSNSLSLC